MACNIPVIMNALTMQFMKINDGIYTIDVDKHEDCGVCIDVCLNDTIIERDFPLHKGAFSKLFKQRRRY